MSITTSQKILTANDVGLTGSHQAGMHVPKKNTSFNIKGQPIVNDPHDAIICFLKYNIDYLAIGDYIVEKK